ncbi:uncharacterized protein Y057_2114 [Fusarium fujikuroi]|nr:uncharacterized protein Y057_2114 [Fusarium fujikuroi]
MKSHSSSSIYFFTSNITFHYRHSPQLSLAMSGLEVFGAAAAIPTIVKQLFQFISSTNKALKGIRNAVEKYDELTQDLISISKVIDCAGKTITRLVEENGAASPSGELNFEPLIQQMERDIGAAQRKLESLEPGSSLKDRANFVMKCRVEIEAVIVKVSQTGMFLNITLVNLLMQAIVEESTSNSLKQSLINSGIQTSLDETLEAVKDAVRDVLNRSTEPESQVPENSNEGQLTDRPESIKSTISGKSWYTLRRHDSNGSLRQQVISKVRDRFKSSTSRFHGSKGLLEGDYPAITPGPECNSAPENMRTSVNPANANDGSPDQRTQSHVTENRVLLPDIHALAQDDTADLGSPKVDSAVSDIQDQASFEREANARENSLNDGISRATNDFRTSSNFMASSMFGHIDSPRLMDILRNNESTGKISHSHKPTDAIEQSLLDTRSWVSADIEEGVSYGVLVFQRPDNWIQLSILPRDHDEATVLETPLLQAMENTPLSCHLKYRNSDSRNLRIYFFTAKEKILSICTVVFRPPFLVEWFVQGFSHTSGGIPPPLPGMGFFCDTDNRTISYASATGSLVSASESEAGQWSLQSSLAQYRVRHGDQVTQRVWHRKPNEDKGPSLSLRIYRQGNSTTHEFIGVDDWDHSLHRADKVEDSKKEIHWQGLTIDETSIPYIPIKGLRYQNLNASHAANRRESSTQAATPGS